jgi:hypothetical protein
MGTRTSGNFLRKTTSSLASRVLSNTIFPSREARTTPPELNKWILLEEYWNDGQVAIHELL